MNNIQKLQEKLSTAFKRRDYVSIEAIRKELNAELMRKERVSLQSLVNNMTEEQRIKALSLMHKLFIFADILYGAALDFESYLKKFDKSIDVEVVNQSKQAANICRGITRNVDHFKDEELSEDFGNLCDEVQMIAMNCIYKHEAKHRKK